MVQGACPHDPRGDEHHPRHFGSKAQRFRITRTIENDECGDVGSIELGVLRDTVFNVELRGSTVERPTQETGADEEMC